MPAITVLMPVFNGEKYLREAIESILDQTFADFEFLIIDDGSTDHSLSIIEEYARRDARIRIVSRENRGLVSTLNEGIDLARGAYLARMDCDDISLPHRLATQYRYMRAHPRCVVCGCLMYYMKDDHERYEYDRPHGVPPSSIWSACMFYTPFGHPSVFMNTASIRAHGLHYDPDYKAAEDFELWSRIILGGHECAVIDEYLMLYRIHDANAHGSNRPVQMRFTMRVVERNLRASGLDTPAAVLQRSIDGQGTAGERRYDEANAFLFQVFRWIERFSGIERQALHRDACELLHRLWRFMRETDPAGGSRLFRGLHHKRLLRQRSSSIMRVLRFLPDAVVPKIEPAIMFCYGFLKRSRNRKIRIDGMVNGLARGHTPTRMRNPP